MVGGENANISERKQIPWKYKRNQVEKYDGRQFTFHNNVILFTNFRQNNFFPFTQSHIVLVDLARLFHSFHMLSNKMLNSNGFMHSICVVKMNSFKWIEKKKFRVFFFLLKQKDSCESLTR